MAFCSPNFQFFPRQNFPTYSILYRRKQDSCRQAESCSWCEGLKYTLTDLCDWRTGLSCSHPPHNLATIINYNIKIINILQQYLHIYIYYLCTYIHSSPKEYISRVKGMYVYVLQCTKTLQHDCNVYNRFVGMSLSEPHSNLENGIVVHA